MATNRCEKTWNADLGAWYVYDDAASMLFCRIPWRERRFWLYRVFLRSVVECPLLASGACLPLGVLVVSLPFLFFIYSSNAWGVDGNVKRAEGRVEVQKAVA